MRASFNATLALVLAFGCADQPTSPEAPNETVPATDVTMNSSVVHRASMGGADVCGALGLPTGCDANFSLVANQKADGSVKGQWQDVFAGGAGQGIHVAVDCLNVVGNGAVIGGVITNGSAGGVDLSGQLALTAIVDNGTSAGDPADQLSFSFIGTGPTGLPIGPASCTELTPADFPLNALTQGQVVVQ